MIRSFRVSFVREIPVFSAHQPFDTLPWCIQLKVEDSVCRRRTQDGSSWKHAAELGLRSPRRSLVTPRLPSPHRGLVGSGLSPPDDRPSVTVGRRAAESIAGLGRAAVRLARSDVQGRPPPRGDDDRGGPPWPLARAR
ncbi:hypothetical protein NL676_032985 [Syzygium grande]|nr:hypothetical protein NL676_032985 [Syzygium grande]